jgi:hypothetical protein
VCSENYLACFQANRQRSASGFNASTTNVEEPSRNLQNIKDKQADRPRKTRATCYCIDMLLLLNCCGSKLLILKNVCI